MFIYNYNKNSKNNPIKKMSLRIRQKFRQQIRARQISQMMKIQREKALSESHSPNIFVLLDQRIKLNAKLPTDMTIIQDLVDLLDNYPKEQNTYILVGNFVINHSDTYKYFELRVLGLSDIAKKLQNYKWALLIILTRSEQTNQQILPEYDQTISQIISNSPYSELTNCLKILHLILTLQNLAENKKYIPILSIKQFFNTISGLQFKELKPDLQYGIITVVHGIGEYHLDHHVMREFVPDLVRILVIGIEEYCTFRPDFIVMLKKISIDYFEEFQDLFRTQLGQDLLNQVMYMYTNLKNERSNILTIFQSMVNQFSYQLLLQLLSNGLHLTLLSTFQDKTPEHLAQALKIIHSIFNRIQQKQQQTTLHKLMDHLEQNKFQIYLQNLFNERHDPYLEKVMKELVDDYYSDEIV